MKRREFIKLVGGTVFAWPLAARAQQPERMRRIGVLMSVAAEDPYALDRVTALAQGLQELGWTVGRKPMLHPGGLGAKIILLTIRNSLQVSLQN
jgi:putative ABC transport system substrate-binding protein